MRQLNADVGLVCAIPYGTNSENMAAHVEASILNGPIRACCFGHPRWVMDLASERSCCFAAAIFCARRLRRDFAHRRRGQRHGEGAGANRFAHGFSHRPVRQELGRRTFRDVYQRQLRWSVIRRGDALLSFLAEPFCQAFPALIAAGVAAPLAKLTPFAAAGATLLLWFALETCFPL